MNMLMIDPNSVYGVVVFKYGKATKHKMMEILPFYLSSLCSMNAFNAHLFSLGIEPTQPAQPVDNSLQQPDSSSTVSHHSYMLLQT
jgi:hypothetical protein